MDVLAEEGRNGDSGGGGGAYCSGAGARLVRDGKGEMVRFGAYCHSMPAERVGKEVGRVDKYDCMLCKASIAEPVIFGELSVLCFNGVEMPFYERPFCIPSTTSRTA